MNDRIKAPRGAIKASVKLPSSKSISNRALILNALSNSSFGVTNLSDCDDTNLMVNADFSQKPDWTGWEGVEGSSLGAWTTKDNRVFTACESWQKPMDLHQTVSGLRPGYYLVSMNGAYRHNNDRYSVAYSAQLYAHFSGSSL